MSEGLDLFLGPLIYQIKSRPAFPSSSAPQKEYLHTHPLHLATFCPDHPSGGKIDDSIQTPRPQTLSKFSSPPIRKMRYFSIFEENRLSIHHMLQFLGRTIPVGRQIYRSTQPQHLFRLRHRKHRRLRRWFPRDRHSLIAKQSRCPRLQTESFVTLFHEIWICCQHWTTSGSWVCGP